MDRPKDKETIYYIYISRSFVHHDHIPYSLEHDQPYDSASFDSTGPTSFEPYAAYSHHSNSESDGPTGHLPPNAPSFRRKRSEPKPSQHHNPGYETLENLARQLVVKEEQYVFFAQNFKIFSFYVWLVFTELVILC